MTKEHIIHLTPLDFKTLAVLAQGDVTYQDIETNGVPNVHFRINELNRKFGAGTVARMKLQKGGTFRLIGQEYLDPDAIKIKKTATQKVNPRVSLKHQSPFNPYGGSRYPSSTSFHELPPPVAPAYISDPEQISTLPESYIMSLPPTERSLIGALVGRSYSDPLETTALQSQVFELMISVSAFPPGFRIGRREDTSGNTSYYLERLPNRPQNIRLQEG